MRNLALTKEKFRVEREFLLSELKTQETATKELKCKYDDQSRLVTNVCGHLKNPGAGLNDINKKDGLSVGDRSVKENEKSERIASQVNRSAFMGIGENPPKLMSESAHSLLRPAVFHEKDVQYMNDDSVPAAIYPLINEYRMKSKDVKPGDQTALMIDDFFGEAHAIIKDANLREIARIRNENQVEIAKLKKVIDKQKSQGLGGGITAQNNQTAFK